MKPFWPYIINTSALALCLAGGYGEREWAENLFIFYSIISWTLIWASIVVTDSKEMVSKGPTYVRFIMWTVVLVCASLGWFFTALLWLSISVGIWLKREYGKRELKKEGV